MPRERGMKTTPILEKVDTLLVRVMLFALSFLIDIRHHHSSIHASIHMSGNGYSFSSCESIAEQTKDNDNYEIPYFLEPHPLSLSSLHLMIEQQWSDWRRLFFESVVLCRRMKERMKEKEGEERRTSKVCFVMQGHCTCCCHSCSVCERPLLFSFSFVQRTCLSGMRVSQRGSQTRCKSEREKYNVVYEIQDDNIPLKHV